MNHLFFINLPSGTRLKFAIGFDNCLTFIGSYRAGGKFSRASGSIYPVNSDIYTDLRINSEGVFIGTMYKVRVPNFKPDIYAYNYSDLSVIREGFALKSGQMLVIEQKNCKGIAPTQAYLSGYFSNQFFY